VPHIDSYRIREVGTRAGLRIGPHYRTPQDDTALVAVSRSASDTGISFLLERDQVAPLADFLASGGQVLAWETASRTLTVHRSGGSWRWSVGSSTVDGSSRSVCLDRAQMLELADWLSHIDAFGWAGWKSGVSA
jgi:hypothetical protein